MKSNWGCQKTIFCHVIKYTTFFAFAIISRVEAQIAEPDPQSFRPIYLGLSWSDVNPVSFSENYYSRGGGHPSVSYRYVMHDQWMVSISGGFKALYDFDGLELPYFTLTQQSSYLYRVYYPTWVSISAQVMYLTAVEKINLPFHRNRDIPTQVGAGASVGILYRYSEYVILNAEISRWRSTKNMTLHVLESSVGASYAIKGF